MSDQRYSKLVQRIFWFTLPLVISLQVFLVVNTYYVKEAVAKVAVKNEAAVDVQNKMWDLVKENNKILSTKADDQENKTDHQHLKDQLDIINDKLSKISSHVKYNYSYIPDTYTDTTYGMPYKMPNDLVWNSK